MSRLLILLLAVPLLIWLGSPYSGYQLDDLFISLAFAEQWVESGDLAWTTGERVEGFSNFGLVALAALGRLVGVPGAVFCRALALLGGVALITAAAVLGPRDGRWVLPPLAFACWTALGYWSTVALETTVFAALLAWGWALVLMARESRPYVIGMALLALSSFFRPEGIAYLCLGAAARLRLPRQRLPGDDAVLAIGAVVLAYQVARIRHFGAILPTPYLVKVGAVEGWSVGLQQLGGDLVAAGGLLAVALLALRPRMRDLPWVLLPLAIESVLLVRANGDWMGMSRLVLPGLAATFVAAAATTPTGRLRAHQLLAIPVCIGAALFEPYWPEAQGLQMRDVASLETPLENLGQRWMTPFRADLAWAVEHLPDGTTIEIADVGLIGQVDGVRLLDSIGLVDRTRAEHEAWGLHSEAIAARYAPGPDQVDCVRHTVYRGGEPSVPASIREAFPHGYVVRDFGLASDWRCAAALEPVPPARQVARWEQLRGRYPMQDFIRKHLAFARIGAGLPIDDLAGLQVDGVPIEVATAFPTPRWPRGDRGVPMYAAGRLVSRPLAPTEAGRAVLHFDVDDAVPGGLPTRIGWEPACGTEEVRLDLLEARVLRPPAVACTSTVRLVVTLEPHADTPPRDRNLYVDLWFE